MAGYVYGGPDAKAKIGRPPQPDDPDACGTSLGIWQHRRAGEKNCDKCREAQNAQRRNSYRRQMANILAQSKISAIRDTPD